MGTLPGHQDHQAPAAPEGAEPGRRTAPPARRGARSARILVALSLLQSALIVFVLARLSDLDARSKDLATRLARAEDASRPAAAATGIAAPGAAAFAGDDLRLLLREELAAVLAQSVGGAPGAPVAAAPAAPAARDPRKTEVLRSEIDRDFTALAGPGRATPASLAALQEKIAKLPPEERRAALGRLSKAMNEGRIDANN